MRNPSVFFLSCLVLSGCGSGAAEAPAPSEPPRSASEASAPEASAPEVSAPAVVEADEARGANDPAPASVGVDRCEGLVGACGGWEGCVMVRADATAPGRFVGVGPNVGHLYEESHDCHDGVCNEVCSGGSGNVCRPGVRERVPDMACSEAFPPSRAPFSCTLRDGACVQGPDPMLMPAS